MRATPTRSRRRSIPSRISIRKPTVRWPTCRATNGSRHDRIVTIDQSGPVTAFAKVECALPPRFFVDYLTLLKTRDGWRIVAKAFKIETR
jgi:hypothetical protein